MMGLAALAGAAISAGILLISSSVYQHRKHNPLIARVEPFLSGWQRPVIPPSRRAMRWRTLVRFLGNQTDLRNRLRMANWSIDADWFRLRQILAGVAAGMLSVPIIILGPSRSPWAVTIMIAVFGATGSVLYDAYLNWKIGSRQKRIMQEFPVIADLLALAVAAGTGVVGAIEKISETTRGELSYEFQQSLADIHAGASVTTALKGISQRVRLEAIDRFIDGLIVAIERGTPLSSTLHAQAADVRQNMKADLMESAGKREIAMMVPIVVFVLPVTVVFALYPGLELLKFSL